MLYTITNSGLQNGRPTRIGKNTINIPFGSTHVFTVANFTTETVPTYSDPENDALSYIKILSLPSTGNLKLGGVNVTINASIPVASITTGNFTYVSNGDGNFSFNFDAADIGSNSLSGLNTGVITMSVAKAVNQRPSVVGDNTVSLNYGESKVFTSADFTSGTTPAYSDPEGDSPSKVKILDLPSNGLLVFNGVNVIANQEMTVAEIDAGYLVYNPNLAITTIQLLDFNFTVSDEGSGLFAIT